ncbi:macrolide family glycosyltransferase [Kitasatospora sp. NBC_01539]|uniref:macrolide family glycosyltransferase n=1 Tax=Kitasatospora sp. NBC_01539 TaxID=2903577 RepID=UPI00386027B9
MPGTDPSRPPGNGTEGGRPPVRGAAHIAVVNLPMHGHVNPSLGIVEELVRRGHRVSYAITADFAPQVQAVGAEPVLFPAPVGDTEPPEQLAEGFGMAVRVSLDSLPALTRAYAEDRPDLVLYDVYGFAGLLLGSQWQVPTVLMSPTHMFYDTLVPEMFGVPRLGDLPGYAELAAAFAERGVSSSRIHDIERAEHAVACLPRAFQRRADTVAAQRVAYVGPPLGDRSHQGAWRPPQDGRPVVLISLGSQFTRRPEFYRSCIEAFTGLPWHVVMSVGSRVDPDGLGPLPDNVEVHPEVPQLAVLAHADAFVTHAGMGGTMEALHHGVPMVAVPQMAEQRVNAAQIERLRLGVHLPRENATPRALREAVLRVTSDPAVRDGIAAMRREMAGAGGARAAADLIEQTLRPGHRVPAGRTAPTPLQGVTA